jgi:hypothetical protein
VLKKGKRTRIKGKNRKRGKGNKKTTNRRKRGKEK